MVLDPLPAPAALREAYGPGYLGAGSRKFIPLVESLAECFRAARARLAARLLGPRDDERIRSVLDIGCGGGGFLARLLPLGVECHGTEFSAATAERASRIPGLRIRVGTLSADDFPAGFFDLVSAWHVLEHLPDPDRALRLSHLWLREGGFLLLAVPNIDSWQARVFRGSWFHLDPPRHLYHFNRRSLHDALRRAGFSVVRETTLSWEQNVYGIVQSALNALGFPRDSLYEALKGNRSAASPWTLPLQILLAAALLAPALLLTVAAFAAGQGGTLEVIARK
jgi:SAM-dependent methyltransferase